MGYPLSGEFTSKLRNLLGANLTISTISELRSLPIGRMLSRLLGITGRFVIATEDEQGEAILPLLRLVALPTRAREILLVGKDLTIRKAPRRQTPALLVSLLLASIRGIIAIQQTRRELKKLNASPRQTLAMRPLSKLLYLKTNLWFGIKAGGSVGHIAGVVGAFHNRGYAVDFVACEPPVLVNDIVRLHQVGLGGAFGVPAEGNGYRLHHIVVKECLRSLSPNYAFIYQRLSVANYSGVTLARRWNVPLVLEYNGSEVWVARHWGRPLRYQSVAEAAEEACLRHASVIVTVSDVLRDELVQRGIEPERIVTYPNCIDPEIFNPSRFAAGERNALRRRHGIPEDAVVATFIGTFGKWHGVDQLAQAIRRLVEERRDELQRLKLHFMLIGDGLLMPLVKELIANEVCQPFCTVTGLVPQADAPAYLAASDIFLSPHVANQDGSRFFGSPTKLFEYMAMGKPIVASDLEQIGDVLRNSLHADALPATAPAANEERLAVLTRPGSVDELIAGILFVAQRQDWRAALGANARNECLKKFTWDRHVAAIVARMEQLLGGANTSNGSSSIELRDKVDAA